MRSSGLVGRRYTLSGSQFLPVARRWGLASVAAQFAALAHGLPAVGGLARDGTWDRLLTGLRQQLRQFMREAEPTAGAIDSQSGRTGGKKGAATATMQANK